jgi:hypothetical protein
MMDEALSTWVVEGIAALSIIIAVAVAIAAFSQRKRK